MSAVRRVFLAATGQNRGKTTVSLGLMAAIAARGDQLGFFKPMGQRYLVVDGTRADEDAVLMRDVFHLGDQLDDMSPITLPRHFTTDFILNRGGEDLVPQVVAAFGRVAEGKDVVVVEGTGHAGVGAVVGLSNARAAAALDAPVIVVSEGGVGRPIDEIVLNCALFAREGVRVIGAIVNKVDVDGRPDLVEVLRRGLEQQGVELLGCLPYSPVLTNPSLELVATHLRGELLAGEPTPGQIVGGVAIGAMQPDHAMQVLQGRTLLITPGDREDLIASSLAANRESPTTPKVIGIVLTGGFRPGPDVLAALRRAGLFTYLVEADTYHTAEAVHDILVKTHPSDREKIATIIDLVARSLDVEALLERIGQAGEKRQEAGRGHSPAS